MFQFVIIFNLLTYKNKLKIKLTNLNFFIKITFQFF